jgi:hypothetical protein
MNQRRTRTVPLLGPKDIPILNFIWWWKIASTATIIGRYQKIWGWKPATAYWRLSRLRDKGYIQTVYANRQYGVVWMLTAKGFAVVEKELPALREKGFASEHVAHDLLVQAIHLGQWLPFRSPGDSIIYSEQELRRIHPDCYLDWVPHYSFHRPDGYWGIPTVDGKIRVVALEVEVTDKSPGDYQSLANFYANMHRVDSVLWLVSSPRIANKMQRAALNRADRVRDIHQFVTREDFLKRGWQTPIFLGTERGKDIETFLTAHMPSQGRGNAESTPLHDWTKVILDTRASRVDSVPYALEAKTNEV